MKKSTMRALLVAGIVLIVLLSFRRREGFRFHFKPNTPDNSNNCNLRGQSNCLGYGSDGYCQWCGSNGCRSSDEVGTMNLKGCKG